MLPNFVYIGADRSGSTWIYDVLQSHPEVFIPKAKDFYFFDKYFHLGLPWYERQFSGWKGQKAVGDISHDYLYSQEACERIKRHLPGVKLIACLRQPVEKAFASYLVELKHGLVEGDLENAARKNPEILSCSYYADGLKRYIDAFGRDRLLVLRFEEALREPERFMERIYRFLEISPNHRPPELYQTSRPASAPRNRWVAYAAKQGAYALRTVGLPNVLGVLKHSKALQKLLYIPLQNGSRPKPTEEERSRLWSLYKEDVDKLERLLGEDFSEWRRPDFRSAKA